MSYVLVIDSDSSTSELLRLLLPTDDYRLEEEPSCDEGLAHIKQESPVLIVLCSDIRGGFATCRKLKRDKSYRELTLVLVSGNATEKQLAEHKRLPTHADFYFRKPLDSDTFLKAIAGILSISESAIERPEPKLSVVPEPQTVSSRKVASGSDLSNELAEVRRAYAELVEEHEQSVTQHRALSRDKHAIAKELEDERESKQQAADSYEVDHARLNAQIAQLTRDVEFQKKENTVLERARDSAVKAVTGIKEQSVEHELRLEKFEALNDQLSDAFNALQSALESARNVASGDGSETQVTAVRDAS